ncbi:MAG TPA: hypothetical protein VFQ21_09450 [Gemmatimonadota bacterium]|nr:hypothetical protein [Gemmatimonadota bacterium]
MRLCAFTLAFLYGCGGGDQSTACEGFEERDLAILSTEYRPCAGEILAELDALRPLLEEIVAGETTDAGAARRHYESLEDRVDATGIMDDYRSMRPSTVVVKWPETSTRTFNQAAFDAMVRYEAVLAFPSEDVLSQGIRSHDQARQAFDGMR